MLYAPFRFNANRLVVIQTGIRVLNYASEITRSRGSPLIISQLMHKHVTYIVVKHLSASLKPIGQYTGKLRIL